MMILQAKGRFVMKKIYILIGTLILLSTFVIGQNAKTQPDDIPPTKDKSSKSSKGENNSAGSLILAGTGLEAQLQSSVDVRKNKVGDEVVLKTTKSIKQGGEVVVPKGTNLVGRITEIQQKTKETSGSKIGMIFDRLEGKNLDVPINASIISVVTAQGNAAAGDLFSTDVSGSSSTSGRASSGNGSSSGGLLGGVGSTAGGLLNTTTQTVGSVAGTATNTVGSVAGTATNTVGSTTGTLGRTVNGLQISQSVSGSASSSSTISSQNKNIKLDKGATFQLMVNGSATQN
jgi:hypothetical protein